jgi:hypothetical protein
MNVGLLYVCAFAGLVIVLGSLLLIWKGRLLVDSERGEITEVELPGGFKLKTQRPILVMFLFGSFLLAMPIYVVRNRLNGIPKVVISGRVQNNSALSKLEAYAIIADSNVTNEVKFYLPQLEDTCYRVIYRDPKDFRFVFDQLVDLKQAADGTFNLLPFNVTNAPQQGAAAVASTVNTADTVKEDPSVVNDFK